MTEYIVQDTSLTAVANKIRSKTGNVAPLEFPDEFVSEIGRLAKIPDTPNDSILFYSLNPFTVGIYNKTKNWDGALYYSVDNAEWTEWDGTTELSPALNNGFYLLYLKGSGNTVLSGSTTGKQGFEIIGSLVKCVGNFINLLDSLGTYPCALLFADCPNIDFDIILPFTDLSSSCYLQMFSGCSSLTKAPALPAENLTTGCYSQMFLNCSNLQNAPVLNSTHLADSCYYGMFRGCVKLEHAPDLPATTATASCYTNMFYGCVNLKQAPDLPATTLAGSCYSAMFQECTKLLNVPALPATTLATRCYSNMFAACTSLTNSPKLPAVNLDTYCYYRMFLSCDNLESISELPATTLKNFCYNGMYDHCSKIKLSLTQVDEYQIAYRIPSLGTGTTASNALTSMFSNTGGTFTSNPTINTTYYTSNTVISAT